MISDRFTNDGTNVIQMSSAQIDAKKSILKKLEHGEYKIEKVSCLCGSKNFELLSNKDRFGLPVTLVICIDCGLVQLNPRMTEMSYMNFYNSEYRTLISGDVSYETLEKKFHRNIQRGKRIYAYLLEHISNLNLKKITVAEVGCGSGGILKFFEMQGAVVLGCDYDSKTVHFGKKQGLNIIYGGVHDILIRGYTADLIILSHVVEHFLNPLVELRNIKDLLKPNGHIYIEVPGLLKLHEDVIKRRPEIYKVDFLHNIGIEHPYFFTLNNLQYLMNQSGFELVSGNENVFSIFRKSNGIPTSKEVHLQNSYLENKLYIEKLESKYRNYKEAVLEKNKPYHGNFDFLKSFFKINIDRDLNHIHSKNLPNSD